jgi:hypothetical protein
MNVQEILEVSASLKGTRTSYNLAALVDHVNDELVRLTPCIGCNAFREAAFEVPARLVTLVEGTGAYAFASGELVPILKVTLGQEAAPSFTMLDLLTEYSGSTYERINQSISKSVLSARRMPQLHPVSGLAPMFVHDFGIVYEPRTVFTKGEDAGCGDAGACGTMFLGATRVSVAVSKVSVALNAGFCAGFDRFVKSYGPGANVFQAWFWGVQVVVPNTFISWNGAYDSVAVVNVGH